MGTPLKPIRLLLSPRSPLSVSPKLGKSSCENLSGNISRKLCENRLHSTSPRNLFREPRLQCNKPVGNLLVADPIKICVSEVSNNATRKVKLLEINSPKKTELLNGGIKNKSILHILGSGTFGTVVEGKYKGTQTKVP